MLSGGAVRGGLKTVQAPSTTFPGSETSAAAAGGPRKKAAAEAASWPVMWSYVVRVCNRGSVVAMSASDTAALFKSTSRSVCSCDSPTHALGTYSTVLHTPYIHVLSTYASRRTLKLGAGFSARAHNRAKEIHCGLHCVQHGTRSKTSNGLHQGPCMWPLPVQLQRNDRKYNNRVRGSMDNFYLGPTKDIVLVPRVDKHRNSYRKPLLKV
jgi:hypothetical protein